MGDQSFDEYIAARNINAARLGAVLVAALIPTGFVLDLLSQPRKVYEFIGIRIACSLLCIVIFFLTRRPGAIKHAFVLGVAPAFLAALAIQAMIERMDGYSSPYYAGHNLVILGLGIVLTWRARETAIVCSMILSIWIIPAVAGPRPLMIGPFFNNLYFLFLTSAIAVISNHERFVLARREFDARQEVARTSKDLALALEKLREFDKAKTQFFANITHELRTPLTMILAPLEGILSEEFGPLTNVQRSYLEANRRSAVRLLKLVNDLLDLAKIEEGFLRLRQEKTDLREIVESVVAFSRPLAARKGLTLNLDVDEYPAHLFVDIEKIERVLVNLLSNALKFTERGGVTVTIRTELEHVRMTVSDTGIGIASESLAKIFERFNQADGSITRRFGGTGIGLAYAKEIVELHGGRIEVQSTPESGSTFSVFLRLGESHIPEDLKERRSLGAETSEPKRSDDQEPTEWAQQLKQDVTYRFSEIGSVTDRRVVSRSTTSEASPRLLLVEDNVEILEFLNILLKEDYRVFAATNGQQGLEIAQRERPDLIITDFMMPEMDGVTMLRAIRADPLIAQIPAIMLTAKGNLDDRVSARAAGVDVYLRKPFSPLELQTAVRQLLIREGRQVEGLIRAQIQGIELMSAGLAHEINNPLNFIKNAHALIRENVMKLVAALPETSEVDGGGSNNEKILPRIDRLVESSRRGIERIERVVEVIRRYAREGYPSTPVLVDVDGAVADVIEAVAPEEERSSKLGVNLAANGSQIMAVSEEFNQVVRGLLENALQSVGENGKVLVRTSVMAAQLIIEVEDDGPGIRADTMRDIFSPFFSTKEGAGRGLGLAAARLIVSRAGGLIEVESQPGIRTTFRVKWPLDSTVSLQKDTRPAS